MRESKLSRNVKYSLIHLYFTVSYPSQLPIHIGMTLIIVKTESENFFKTFGVTKFEIIVVITNISGVSRVDVYCG